MTLLDWLLATDAALILIVGILFVIFAETTVRKLRNNPKTKDSFGIVFFSGWEIVNVAIALSIPEIMIRRIVRSAFSMFYANAALIKQHTTVFDKILAMAFFWLWVFAGVSMIILMILDKTGVLK